MSIPEVLSEMRGLLHARADLLRRIGRAQKAMSKAVESGGMKRETETNGELAHVQTGLSDLLEELEAAEQALAAHRQTVKPAIDSLPPGSAKLALRLRYLEWTSVAEVAERAHYMREGAYIMLKNAEKHLAS